MSCFWTFETIVPTTERRGGVVTEAVVGTGVEFAAPPTTKVECDPKLAIKAADAFGVFPPKSWLDPYCQ